MALNNNILSDIADTAGGKFRSISKQVEKEYRNYFFYRPIETADYLNTKHLHDGLTATEIFMLYLISSAKRASAWCNPSKKISITEEDRKQAVRHAAELKEYENNPIVSEEYCAAHPEDNIIGLAYVYLFARYPKRYKPTVIAQLSELISNPKDFSPDTPITNINIRKEPARFRHVSPMLPYQNAVIDRLETLTCGQFLQVYPLLKTSMSKEVAFDVIDKTVNSNGKNSVEDAKSIVDLIYQNVLEDKNEPFLRSANQHDKRVTAYDVVSEFTVSRPYGHMMSLAKILGETVTTKEQAERMVRLFFGNLTRTWLRNKSDVDYVVSKLLQKYSPQEFYSVVQNVSRSEYRLSAAHWVKLSEEFDPGLPIEWLIPFLKSTT